MTVYIERQDNVKSTLDFATGDFGYLALIITLAYMEGVEIPLI